MAASQGGRVPGRGCLLMYAYAVPLPLWAQARTWRRLSWPSGVAVGEREVRGNLRLLVRRLTVVGTPGLGKAVYYKPVVKGAAAPCVCR